MSQSSRPLGRRDESRCYAAWRSHDLDAIVALHHPEGSFWLHTSGQTIGVGREAIRARFAGTLALLPDIAFESLRVHWGETFLVH
jgi:ketosteroid isomerase-like protein